MYRAKVSAIVLFLCFAFCSLLYVYVKYKKVRRLEAALGQETNREHGMEYYNGLPNRLAANYYPQKETYSGLLFEPNFTTEKSANIDVAFLVKSKTKSFQRRKVIRGTWGSVKMFKNINLFVLFIVGMDSEHEARLAGEAKKFQDIIQVNVSEKFSDQPKKMLSAFHWIIESPGFNPEFFITTEDSCIINIAATLNYLLGHQREIRDSIHCGYMFEKNAGVIRGNGPRSISRKLYPKDTYPPFCRWQLVLLSSLYVEKIYIASTVTNITGFHLEDVLLFGILREKLGIENSIVNIINGGDPLVFYPWDETEKAIFKMLKKWQEWEVYMNASSLPK